MQMRTGPGTVPRCSPDRIGTPLDPPRLGQTPAPEHKLTPTSGPTWAARRRDVRRVCFAQAITPSRSPVISTDSSHKTTAFQDTRSGQGWAGRVCGKAGLPASRKRVSPLVVSPRVHRGLFESEWPGEATWLHARQHFQSGCPAAAGRTGRRRRAETRCLRRRDLR